VIRIVDRVDLAPRPAPMTCVRRSGSCRVAAIFVIVRAGVVCTRGVVARVRCGGTLVVKTL
jgi:hypothetical protein